VVGHDLRDDLRIGYPPVNIDNVLDAEVVDTLERGLIHDQVPRDERELFVTESAENAEDTLTALGSNKHVGVSVRALPGLFVEGVRERSPFEYQRDRTLVLQRPEDADEFSNPNCVAEYGERVGSHFTSRDLTPSRIGRTSGGPSA
jgi:hypothetical protein